MCCVYERERAVVVELKRKILKRPNQNASIAVPDDSPDRRLIIDLDINQNGRHIFVFVSLEYLRRYNRLGLYMCSIFLFIHKNAIVIRLFHPS